MTQLDLTLPAHNHTPTSVEAAESVRESAATLRARVLAYLERQGTHGATDEEMQRALSMSGNTQRPRRRELETRGLIMDSGETRQTATGRRAVVWRVK